jgi:adenosylcobinamide kinase/adenosylcobinamide-phosphate guanylyltransferase
MALNLILGGARSGKSAFALKAVEAQAAKRGVSPLFIATAQAYDDEMAARIAQHRAERGDRWRLVEAPLDLGHALIVIDKKDLVLVDCLTLWLSNSMLQEDGRHEQRTAELLAALGEAQGDLWIVSNEVGWGIVPDNALARRYRDEAGRLHQRIAEIADGVILIVAGLSIILKAPKHA